MKLSVGESNRHYEVLAAIWGSVLAFVVALVISAIIVSTTVFSPQQANKEQAIWEACLAHNVVSACEISLGVSG